MRVVSLCLGVAVGALGVASHARAETVDVGGDVVVVGAGERESLRGNVLVWHDAAFFVEPNEAAASIHLAKLGAPRKDSGGHVVAMRVVGARGSFVEVEPTSADCGSSWLTMPDDVAKLHLFVKRSDLAPVLTSKLDKTFADGTRVVLRPGVAVVPQAASGHVLVHVGDDVVDIDVPGASVGHSYVPERAKPTVINAQDYALTKGTAATLGDRPASIGAHAQAITRRGDKTLFVVDAKCAQLTVAVPSGAVSPVDDDHESVDFSSDNHGNKLDLRGSDYLPVNTQLATPSGTAIAMVAKKIYLPSTGLGRHACFDRKLRLDGDNVDRDVDDDRIRLCAPTAKVAHDKLSTR